MKARPTWQSCCILFSVAIAMAPVIQAADQKYIMYAKAIGEEETPSPVIPKKSITPAKSKNKIAPAPAETAVQPAEKTPEAATESKPKVSKTAVWIGLGIAAVLAVAGGGGGGGGGGGSTAPPHP